MRSDRSKLAAASVATALVLLAATALKLQASRRAWSPSRAPLAPGSSYVVREARTRQARPADSSAPVTSTPPRMLHLDPARTNRSPFLGPAHPAVAWQLDAAAPIEAAPVVTPDGVIVIGTLGGELLGVGNDGREQFHAELQDRIYGTVLVTDSGMFVGSDADRFFGLSHRAARRWSLSVDGDADTSAVQTSYGAIVFAAGKVVYAVRADGSVLWRVKAKRKVYSSPAAAPDGTVFVGSQDDRLYAIGRDGKIRFATTLQGDVDCAPSVGDDGTVYVGTDVGTVVALDPERGAVRWTRSVGGFVRGSLTLTRRHTVLAGVYGPAPRVVSLDAATGEELWSFGIQGTGAPEFGVHGSPVEDRDGNLYFGAQDDSVYSLTSEGELRWRMGVGGDVDGPVVLTADGQLVAVSDDGKIYGVSEGVANAATPR